MDSKQVTREINSVIRPILKENGFKKFSGRTYWRYESERIDILNFQSFNSYNADVMGCTTFSFAVNLAAFMNYSPSETEIKEKNGLKRPQEYQGHFRTGIKKGIEQTEFPRESIWFVDQKGKYLTDVVLDCKTQIESKALDWYRKFETKEQVLRILKEDQIDMNETWGFGNIGSPNRNKFIAYTANELGQIELATEKLNKLMSFYKVEYDRMKYNYYLDRIRETKQEIKRIKTTHNNR